MRFEQYKTPPQPLPHTDCGASGLERDIEKAVAQAFKPLTDRLTALENQTEYERNAELRGLNGKRIRVDIGTNQERIQS